MRPCGSTGTSNSNPRHRLERAVAFASSHPSDDGTGQEQKESGSPVQDVSPARTEAVTERDQRIEDGDSQAKEDQGETGNHRLRHIVSSMLNLLSASHFRGFSGFLGPMPHLLKAGEVDGLGASPSGSRVASMR